MDCTFKTKQGNFNYRVGAIILSGRKILMARNPGDKREYYYSVGGRVLFGEELTDAVLRELKEETGIDCEIDCLFCIHENFFTADEGIPFHEVSVFFTIKENENLLQIKDGHLTDHGPAGEYLEWIDPDDCDGVTIYPEFFKTVDFEKETDVRHFVSREQE